MIDATNTDNASMELASAIADSTANIAESMAAVECQIATDMECAKTRMTGTISDLLMSKFSCRTFCLHFPRSATWAGVPRRPCVKIKTKTCKQSSMGR